MHLPVIGVIPLVDYEKESYWMLPGYFNGLIEAGAAPMMLPLTEDPDMIRQFLDLCDGVLLTGGHDVCPVLYGEKEEPFCGECSPERDRMELIVLEEALRRDLAVFGICRGLQFLNVAMGGTLYQDLPTQHPSDLVHVMKKPYDTAAHRVEVLPGTPLEDLLADCCEEEAGREGRAKHMLGVNSLHHQAVRDLAPGMEVMAVSEDGLTEALRLKDKRFVWAVQWHPEFSYRKEESSRRLLKAFAEAAAAREIPG